MQLHKLPNITPGLLTKKKTFFPPKFFKKLKILVKRNKVFVPQYSLKSLIKLSIFTKGKNERMGRGIGSFNKNLWYIPQIKYLFTTTSQGYRLTKWPRFTKKYFNTSLIWS